MTTDHCFISKGSLQLCFSFLIDDLHKLLLAFPWIFSTSLIDLQNKFC